MKLTDNGERKVSQAELTRHVTNIRRTFGVKAAKAWAKDKGYAIRWDNQGNLYIRDLLAD